jgi:CheY-like chemotaxis protein
VLRSRASIIAAIVAGGRLYLPRGNPGALAALSRSMTPIDTPGKAADPPPIVLVIEPDVLIRMSIAAYLRECGFRVIEAGNDLEAMSVLETDTAVSVVFSDVGDEGSGFGLAQWLRRERPDIRTVLTSGLKRTAREAGKLCAEGPHDALPYDHALLEQRIRQLIASQS